MSSMPRVYISVVSRMNFLAGPRDRLARTPLIAVSRLVLAREGTQPKESNRRTVQTRPPQRPGLALVNLVSHGSDQADHGTNKEEKTSIMFRAFVTAAAYRCGVGRLVRDSEIVGRHQRGRRTDSDGGKVGNASSIRNNIGVKPPIKLSKNVDETAFCELMREKYGPSYSRRGCDLATIVWRFKKCASFSRRIPTCGLLDQATLDQ